MATGIEFDWDAENTKQLAADGVTAGEFEYVKQTSPFNLAYEVVDGEGRYRSVGVTGSGRLLVAAWMSPLNRASDNSNAGSDRKGANYVVIFGAGY